VDSRGTNIICFGDSITFGYGAGKGEDFPTLLGKLAGVPVINAGIDGDSSTEALQRLKADVLDRQPLLVVIEFGGNDFLRKVPIDVTLANLREMIDKAQAQGSMVAVADISAGMFMKEYRVALSRLCREKGAIFIPSILRGIITNPSMKSDFLHPNNNGYKMIAQRIYRALSPYLTQNAILKQQYSKSPPG
jgi:lysophospholipase L1-like esterase